MDTMSIESSSPPDSLKSSSLSPTFEHLSYLDSDPPFPDIYTMSNSISRRSPYLEPSHTGPAASNDGFHHENSNGFVPSSNSSEGTWDEYIAWDALRSPMDFHPTWPSRPSQAPTNAPLFTGFGDPWRSLEEPASAPTLPHGQSSSSNDPPFDQEGPSSMDTLGDFLMSPISSSISSYPPQFPSSSSAAAQPTPTPTLTTHDSGFVSRSASYTGKPSDLSLQTTAPSTRSGSRSPSTSNRSPIKRRSNPIIKTEDEPDFKRPKPRKSKSAAHNDVEKRYRTNLNAKIAELSASVPSLRAAMQQNSAAMGSENASGEEMEGETGRPGYPVRGLKKATVLSRATEYIRHLEGENRRLEVENADLRKRLRLCGRIAVDENMK